jgi:hypothetical protein
MRFNILLAAAALASLNFVAADVHLETRETDLVVRDEAPTYDLVAREPDDYSQRALQARGGLIDAMSGTNAEAAYVTPPPLPPPRRLSG